MKKTLIALAVAGFSFNAAAVNLTATDADIQVYAQELKSNAQGNVKLEKVELNGVNFEATYTYVVVNGTAQTGALAKTAFTSQYTAPHVRVELADATANGLVAAGPGAGAIVDVAADDSYYVVQVDPAKITIADADVTLGADDSAGAGNALVTAKVTVGVTDAANLEIITKTSATPKVTASLFDTQANAIGGFPVGLLAPALQNTLVKFDQFAKVVVTDSKKAIVDVGYDSIRFTNGATFAELFKAEVEFTTGVLNADGNSAQPTDVTGTWSVEGPFLKDAKVGGTTVAASNKFDVTLTSGAVNYVLPADNTAEILTGVVQATWTPSALTASKYSLSAETVNATEIKKNGDFAEADLVFNKDTTYRTLLRVSNKGSQAGDISFTVYADDGSFKSFPLSAVAGQASDVLAANASTTQIDLKDLGAAAEAAGLQFSGEGKMRVKAEGNVTDLSLQTYVVGKDGQNIVKFN